MSSLTSIRDERTSAHPVNDLEDQCQSLARRLDEGYARIETALQAGRDVTSWERFWIDLLHEYESVCNQIQQAA